MNINFRKATKEDAKLIALFVHELTDEICELTSAAHFDIKIDDTTTRCRDLIAQGHYAAIIAFDDESPIGMTTITETYALYAAGKVGVIQEFYLKPRFRASGVGSKLLEQVKDHGKANNWSSFELCTPPLPEFEHTLNFYQKNGLKPVGGRKMRQTVS